MDLSSRHPMPDAFDPSKHDDTGLSVYRLRFHSPEEVANFRTMSTKATWIAFLPVSCLGPLGLSVQPNGKPDQPGHALIPELTYLIRKTPQAETWKRQLAAAVTEVKGPLFGRTTLAS